MIFRDCLEDADLKSLELKKRFMQDYYIIPDIEALGRTTDPAEQEIHRRRIAVNIGDSETLMQILGISNLDPDSFYPDQLPPELSTVDTIDAFLGKFGSNLPETSPVGIGTDEEEQAIPVAPAVDYLTLLAMEESRPTVESAQTPTKDEEGEVAPALRVSRPEIPADTPDLTESFAKVLIKNGNYYRACEILEQLHLKNPEKSIYFADQMRFLRKLMAISGAKES